MGNWQTMKIPNSTLLFGFVQPNKVFLQFDFVRSCFFFLFLCEQKSVSARMECAEKMPKFFLNIKNEWNSWEMPLLWVGDEQSIWFRIGRKNINKEEI